MTDAEVASYDDGLNSATVSTARRARGERKLLEEPKVDPKKLAEKFM